MCANLIWLSVKIDEFGRWLSLIDRRTARVWTEV